jgi:hypothetical protein
MGVSESRPEGAPTTEKRDGGGAGGGQRSDGHSGLAHLRLQSMVEGDGGGSDEEGGRKAARLPWRAPAPRTGRSVLRGLGGGDGSASWVGLESSLA